jgi:tetratricopeptide (TPR) repeat protein
LLIEFDRATNDERIGRQVAGLLDQMGQATASETILRRWYERGHTVQRLIALAIQIGKRGGVAEALDLCDRLDNPAAAEAAVRAVLSVLSHPEATSQHLDRGQRWLEGWLHQHPQSLPLLVGLADLQSLRGRYDQSQQLYHRVLLRDPHNLAALNHWATELALRGRHSEALPLIHRAIASHGELPALLETRGLIHLEAGRLEAAVSDLERGHRRATQRGTILPSGASAVRPPRAGGHPPSPGAGQSTRLVPARFAPAGADSLRAALAAARSVVSEPPERE